MYYSVKEAAEELGIPYPLLRTWVREGKVKVIKLSRRTYRVPKEEVERLRKEMSDLVKFYDLRKNSDEWVPISKVSRLLCLEVPFLKKVLQKEGVAYVEHKAGDGNGFSSYSFTLVNKKDLLSWLSRKFGRKFDEIPEMLALYSGRGKYKGGRVINEDFVRKAVEAGEIPCLELEVTKDGKKRVRILKEDYEALKKKQKQEKIDGDYIPLKELADILRVSPLTIKSILRKHGIEVVRIDDTLVASRKGVREHLGLEV